MSKSASSERGNAFLKFFDRWVGIPLVLMLSMFKTQKNKPAANPKRIGLLIPAAIGDTIVATPIFDALRSKYPEADIVVFASNSNMAIFSLLTSPSKVVCLPIKRPWLAIKTIRDEGQFDWWIDFGQWARLNALLSFFAHSSFKVGFQTPHQSRHFLYDDAVEHLSTAHELQNFGNLLKPFDLKTHHLPHIALPAESKKKQIVIHMFAGGTKPYLKEWPLENWAALINQLTQQGFQIILTGVSENRATADELILNLNTKSMVINAVGVWSLKKVAQELKASHAVVSVNTGIMHLAAALDCNLVSLQGPTSVKRWGPTNKNAMAIQSPLSCSPCLNLGFEYGCPYNNCMRAITVESVLSSLKLFI